MQINAKTKNIIVEPTMCKGEKDGFSLVFRYPNQNDLIRISSVSDNPNKVMEFINELFVEFVNKPELVDEDGKAIEYSTFKDLMGYGGSELSSILTDITEKFTSINKDAGRLEKKS